MSESLQPSGICTTHDPSLGNQQYSDIQESTVITFYDNLSKQVDDHFTKALSCKPKSFPSLYPQNPSISNPPQATRGVIIYPDLASLLVHPDVNPFFDAPRIIGQPDSNKPHQPQGGSLLTAPVWRSISYYSNEYSGQYYSNGFTDNHSCCRQYADPSDSYTHYSNMSYSAVQSMGFDPHQSLYDDTLTHHVTTESLRPLHCQVDIPFSGTISKISHDTPYNSTPYQQQPLVNGFYDPLLEVSEGDNNYEELVKILIQ